MAYLLNLTMAQVFEHHEVLSAIDTQFLLSKNTNVYHGNCWSTTFHNCCYDLCTGITRLTTELINLEKNDYALYEYIKVLAIHLFNPIIASPDEQRTILA